MATITILVLTVIGDFGFSADVSSISRFYSTRSNMICMMGFRFQKKTMTCDWCETASVAHKFALLPEGHWHRAHRQCVLDSPVLNPLVLVLYTPRDALDTVRHLMVALMVYEHNVWTVSADDRRYCHAAVYQIMTSRRCSNRLLPSFDCCCLLWLTLLRDEFVTTSGDVYLTADTLQRLVHGARCLLSMFTRRGPRAEIEVDTTPFAYTHQQLGRVLEEHAIHATTTTTGVVP
jgi:hypothetical protein